MRSSTEQSKLAPVSSERLLVSVARLSDSVDQLLTLDALKAELPFWQHPRWWQLANETLFDGTIELVSIVDQQGTTLAALPVQRIGGLIRSPKHDHLTVGDSLWYSANTENHIDDIMDSLLAYLNAWAWESSNSPDHTQVRLCEKQPKWQWRKARESAWFDTSGDVPIPGKLRRNLKRHERNLTSAHSAVEYSVTTTDNPEQLSNAMNAFLSLEAAGWKGKTGTAINASDTLKAFYQGMLGLDHDYIQLEVHQLHVAERCIASQLAFLCGKTRYLLKISYDEEFATWSPGSLLLLQTLQHCTECDTEKLSLVSAPVWADRWKPDLHPVWHVTRYANSVQGTLREKLSRAKRGVIHQLRDSRKSD